MWAATSLGVHVPPGEPQPGGGGGGGGVGFGVGLGVGLGFGLGLGLGLGVGLGVGLGDGEPGVVVLPEGVVVFGCDGLVLSVGLEVELLPPDEELVLEVDWLLLGTPV